MPLPVRETSPVGDPVNPCPPLTNSHVSIAPVKLTASTLITTPSPPPPVVVTKSPTPNPIPPVMLVTDCLVKEPEITLSSADVSPPETVIVSPILKELPPFIDNESRVIPPGSVRVKLSAFADKTAPLPLPVIETNPVGDPVNPYPPLISNHPVIRPRPSTDVTLITTPSPSPPTVVK